MIIGISGKAGSGKDTAAAQIIKINNSFKYASFAGSLKRKVAYDFDLSKDDVFTNEGKERKTRYKDTNGWSLTVRDLLQQVGSFYRGINPDYWVERCFKEMHEDEDYVITDVRYPNEAMKILESPGGVLIRVDVSPEVQALRVKNIDRNHLSETALDDFPRFSARLNGDLPLDAYLEAVTALYNKIRGLSN